MSDWHKTQAKTITTQLRQKYGSGWDHLSEDARQNAASAMILDLILSQDLDKYAPAQSLAQGIRASL